mmetsp:Transcript_62574/g.116378  ORF Transcript_62574/g.116378 Transcript_62574/m.116378 type:complete len:385 (-) Transcript_62574:129-1283(-)
MARRLWGRSVPGAAELLQAHRKSHRRLLKAAALAIICAVVHIVPELEPGHKVQQPGIVFTPTGASGTHDTQLDRTAGRRGAVSHAADYIPPAEPDSNVVVVERPPQVEAWNKFWSIGSIKRMRSTADSGHIHAMTGGVYMLIGLIYLINICVGSFIALNGFAWPLAVPDWALLGSMFVGVASSATGLQPGLLANPRGDLMSTLGLGSDANLKSGGFINAAVFHLILTYQGLRVLPFFPSLLTIFDPVVATVTLLAMVHTAVLLRGWVTNGSMHVVDTLLLPPLMNLPVTINLLFYGQSWIDSLASQHPGWPTLFFLANYLLAWATSTVSFVLSLHERRVISLELRGVLLLGIPLWAFLGVIILAGEHVPEFFGQSVLTMFTLSP